MFSKLICSQFIMEATLITIKYSSAWVTVKKQFTFAMFGVQHQIHKHMKNICTCHYPKSNAGHSAHSLGPRYLSQDCI